MEQREVVLGKEWWRWTVGVGATAGVDATMPQTRHGAELAWERGRARLAARVGERVGDVDTQ
jgi:hypothetical protein